MTTQLFRVAHITTVDVSLHLLLLNQLLSIEEQGYKVTGISSPGDHVSVIEATGIQHIAVPMTRNFTPLADLVSLWRLYRILSRERFEIVHTHNPKPGLLGQLAAKMAGVPIIVNTIHGFYFHDGMSPFWQRFYILMEKIAARHSDAILSQNREDVLTAIDKGICSPDKIKYLGNGIDIHRFDRARVSAKAIARKRKEFNIDASRPVVGFTGRLVTEKGVLELLQAARLILDKISDVQFVFVGPIDREKPDALTPAVAKKYGVANACIFTGMCQDMPELYGLMDVFVLPSHREGFPRSPMEASAMSVPCVVTNIRGCREAVEHNRNGLLVPLGDVNALAIAILRLLSDRDLAQRMGEAGREMAKARFDEQQVFDKIKAEYTHLLGKKGLPLPETSVVRPKTM